MVRNFLIAMLVLQGILIGEPFSPPLQSEEWRLVSRLYDGEDSTEEWLLKGETFEAWTECFMVHHFTTPREVTVDDYYQWSIGDPAFQHRVHSQSESELLFERWTA